MPLFPSGVVTDRRRRCLLRVADIGRRFLCRTRPRRDDGDSQASDSQASCRGARHVIAAEVSHKVAPMLIARADRQPGEHGEPESAADLLGGIERTRGDPGVAWRRATNGDGGECRVPRAEADGDEETGWQHVGDIARVGRQLAEETEAGDDAGQADEEHALLSHAGDETDAGAERDDRDHNRDGQEGEAGAQRVIAEELLQVDHAQVLETEQTGHHERLHQVAEPGGPAGKQPQRQQRRRRSGLTPAERAKKRHRTGPEDGQRPTR